MILTVTDYYDYLIADNNDPVHDIEPLRRYMDKWDGQEFIAELQLNLSKDVLEIGVGTGRLAVRTIPECRKFCGIDISEKSVERARVNLEFFKNVELICGDFLDYHFKKKFDIVYSSLTFMHISKKQQAINKVAELLNNGGRFVLSIDKNKDEFINYGKRKVEIFPDNAAEIKKKIKNAGLEIKRIFETEFATVFVAKK